MEISRAQQSVNTDEKIEKTSLTDVKWPTAAEMEEQYRINAENKKHKKSGGKQGWQTALNSSSEK